jgi:hypothetical protein
MIRIGLVLWLQVLIASMAFGHEVRPAYLEIRETEPAQYQILWKTPARGDATIRLEVRLPANCTDLSPKSIMNDGAAQAVRWQVKCAGGLAGETVAIDGLDTTLVETIVRFERADGATQSARLKAGETSLVLDKPSTLWGVASVYLPLGIDHILLGFDHLCFVLVLLLLIRDVRRLIWSITAFTAAHSITLAAASLGWVTAPSGPVEALIAFSIAVVAAEVVSVNRGQDVPGSSQPWIIAFAFGLLHGFGFAGALSETGLPADAVPSALLFFNVGVEVGQLIFVGCVLALGFVVKRAWPRLILPASTATAYAVGALAAYWTIDRVVSIT